jgi:hypothetical protein
MSHDKTSKIPFSPFHPQKTYQQYCNNASNNFSEKFEQQFMPSKPQLSFETKINFDDNFEIKELQFPESSSPKIPPISFPLVHQNKP